MIDEWLTHEVGEIGRLNLTALHEHWWRSIGIRAACARCRGTFARTSQRRSAERGGASRHCRVRRGRADWAEFPHVRMQGQARALPASKHWDIVTESVESTGRKDHKHTNFRRSDVRLLSGRPGGSERLVGLVLRGSGLATRARFPDGGRAAGGSRREEGP